MDEEKNSNAATEAGVSGAEESGDASEYRCSLPHWIKKFPGGKGVDAYYQREFGDLCIEHDKHYVAQDVSRLEADWKLSSGIWQRKHPLIAALTFVATRVGGVFPWWWRKVKRATGGE